MSKYDIQKIVRYVLYYDGKQVGSEEYDEIHRAYFDDEISSTIFLIRKGTYWGLYDAENDISSGMRFLSISRFKSGAAIVKSRDIALNEKWELINDKFEVISPKSYDYIISSIDGLFVTQMGDKYGVIDSLGNEVLPCEYHDVGDNLTMLNDKVYISLSNDNVTVLVNKEGKVYKVIEKD